MKTKELNEYIKNYLENDKTNSSIMLTGAWGMEEIVKYNPFMKEKDFVKDLLL